MLDLGLYAQDQWVINRLTLNGTYLKIEMRIF